MKALKGSNLFFNEDNRMYHDCLYLLKGENNKIAFCLKFKEWIEFCPLKCSLVVEGDVGSLEEVLKEKYDVECLYCNRKSQLNGASYFFCNLMQIENPFCDSCQFSTYNIQSED